MSIEEEKIRFIFYSMTITIVIFLLIVLNIIFLSNFKKEVNLKSKQLSSGIYNMKKMYLKEVIDRTIQDIKLEEKAFYKEFEDKINDTIKISK